MIIKGGGVTSRDLYSSLFLHVSYTLIFKPHSYNRRSEDIDLTEWSEIWHLAIATPSLMGL